MERSLDEVLEGYLEGIDPVEVLVVPWPTKPGKMVGLRPLLDDELRDCDARARRWAAETGIPYVNQTIVDPATGRIRLWTIRDDDEVASLYIAEVIARALVHPEKHTPFCPNGAADLRGRRIRRETIRTLMRQLTDWTDKTAPVQPPLGTPEEFEKILVVLGEGRGATLLEDYGPAFLRALLLYTVAQHASSTGSTSSTTTPESESGEQPPG
jgi:hypothetical protein